MGPFALVLLIVGLLLAPSTALANSMCGRPTGLTGGSGSDTLVGTNGNDTINGNGGDDIIYGCGGRDTIYGGWGNDQIYGGPAGDDLYGQGDWDTLFGGLQDDHLYGADGNDMLIGGHGTDEMRGENGDDWLRGGTNQDFYYAGAGNLDTASFATATPPAEWSLNGQAGTGINIDVEYCVWFWNNEALQCKEDYEFTAIDEARVVEGHTGRAWGDTNGPPEPVDQVENIVGSPYDDVIRMPLSSSVNHVYLGFGTDLYDWSRGCCDRVIDVPTADTSRAAVAFIEDPLRELQGAGARSDPGLVVVGRPSADSFTVVRTPSTYEVWPAGGTPFQTIDTDPTTSAGNCTVGTNVVCSPPSPNSSIFYINAYGAGGNDTFGNDQAPETPGRSSLPIPTESNLDGGPGSDVLTGGPSDDEILFAGDETYTASGNDALYGNQGDDALISEGAGNSGADSLFGGNGEDQLVVNNACGGHTLDGQGGSYDIAGFARSAGSYAGITARIGTIAYVNSIMFGPNPETCQASSVTSANEVLEGTGAQDWLYGDGNANILWGRDGNDNIYGEPGDDTILGHRGVDSIEAGAGLDTVYGGPDNDTIRGQEGDDTIEGEAGNDTIYGENSNDLLHGNADNDTLYGQDANDTVWGDGGVDWIYGNAGNDKLRSLDGTTDGAVNCGENVDEPTQKDTFDPVINCE